MQPIGKSWLRGCSVVNKLPSQNKKTQKGREKKKNIIYVDETDVQQSHSFQSCWQSEEEPGVLIKIGTGQRLILHGGGQEGFVEDALLVFKSGKKVAIITDQWILKTFVNG